jgi:cobalt-zinc-cadmium efflux system membrane fusion protein
MKGRRAWAALAVAALGLGCSDGEEARARPEAPAVEREPRLCEVEFPPDSPQLTRLRVEAVETARMPLEEVVAPGKIQAIPTRVSRIAVPVPGRIRKVLVGMGDSVESGRILFTLESPEVSSLMSAHRQADAELSQSRAALAKAEADLSRARDLFEHGAIAQKEVLSAEAELARARADLDRAQAARQEIEQRLAILGLKPDDAQQEIAVRAPVTGKILDIGLTAGEYHNDTSAPVITLADLRSVYVVADVPESLIRLITRGERIEVKLAAFPGKVFHGRVARIGDTVNPQTRTIQVIAEMSNPRGDLRPEMFGEIRHEETFQVVPALPRGAIVQRGGRSSVWREKSPGCFEAAEVTYGRSSDGLVPALSGIHPGDRVVTDGAMLLEPSR